MFKSISKRTPKRVFKTCIRLNVCMQYVRDFVLEFEPSNDEETEAKRRLKLLVNAFDKVVLRRMTEARNDSALWDLCNRLEQHIGRAPNIADAIKACVMIIKEDARRGDAIRKLLPVFKEFNFESSGRSNAGKIFAFLSHSVKVDDV